MNKELLAFTQDAGTKLTSNTIEELFPDIKEEIKELLRTDAEAKAEMMKWIQNELNGTQFHAVRYCSVPDNDSSETDKTFSNDYCESYKICPFWNQGVAPVGQTCPLESLQVTKMTKELVEELAIDINEDFTDKILIGELVMFSLLESRAVRGLACLNLGFSNVTIGKNGREYTRSKNFYIDIIKDMQSMKDKLRKSLVSTREDKIKLKQTKINQNAKDIYQETLAKITKKSSQELGLIVDVTEEELKK